MLDGFPFPDILRRFFPGCDEESDPVPDDDDLEWEPEEYEMKKAA
jgi:hypothetical protein